MSYTPTNWSNKKAPGISDKNLNKIEQELKKLDDIVSVPDITETTETTMPNSYDGRLLVKEIGGVCEQESTTGKNFLEISEYNTNASGGTTKRMGVRKVQMGKTYILSGKTLDGILLNGGNAQAFFIDDNNVKLLSGTAEWFTKGFTVDTDLSTATKFEIYTADALANKTIQVQLEEGTVATKWEPYTGGIPSPNPDYPQEIKKSVVRGVKTHGKNLAKSILPYVTTQWGVALYIDCDLKPSTQYTISFNGSAGNTYYFNEWLFDAPEYVAVNDKRTVVTFTTKDELLKSAGTYSESAGWIFLKNGKTQPSDNIFTDLQLEYGTVATTYEPYHGSEITFSNPIDLYGIGDVQDVITSKPIKRKYDVAVFNGNNEAWILGEGNGFYGSVLPYKAVSNQILLCDQYIGATTTWTKGKIGVSESGVLWISDTTCTTLEEWKARLASNPITVVYELAEETTETLPIADQIALNSLATYDGITYLEFDSEVQPTFEGEYGTSKVGGYTLEALLTARSK